MSGWIGFHRSEATRELQEEHPLAFLLLSIIARRARWTDSILPCGIARGDAMIGRGDFIKGGLSERQYRTAKDLLVDTKLIKTRRAKGTAKPGTIATLLDSRVFSLTMDERGEANDEATTRSRRGVDETPTRQRRQTKKGRREEGKKDNTEVRAPEGGISPSTLCRFWPKLPEPISSVEAVQRSLDLGATSAEIKAGTLAIIGELEQAGVRPSGFRLGQIAAAEPSMLGQLRHGEPGSAPQRAQAARKSPQQGISRRRRTLDIRTHGRNNTRLATL